MQQDPSRSLSDTFDALATEPSRRIVRWPYLPFLVTTLVAGLLAILILAMVLEDRQLQRETLHRDIESAAQQLAARVVLVREALSVIALEIGAGAINRNRFDALAQEMIEAKPELIALAHLDRGGNPVWPATLNFAFGAGWDPGALPEVRSRLERATGIPDTQTVLLGNTRDDAAPIALLVPLTLDDRFHGALVAVLSLRELLRAGVTPQVVERYRLSIEKGDVTLAVTSLNMPPAGAPTYAATLAPLPKELRLHASAFRRQAVFPADALSWLAVVLALAVAASLAALARYTTRLQRIDRALLAETSLRRAMENSQATGLAVLDPQGTIRYVNRALTQMTGFGADALVGQPPPFPFWPPVARAANEHTVQRIVAGQIPASGIEMPLQTAAGEAMDAHVNVAPLVDDSGQQIGWMTSLTDVTEPRRIRAELAAAHDRFVRVLESLDAAVSVVASTASTAGAAPALLFGNRAYAETFGADAAGHQRLHDSLRGGDSGEVLDEKTATWFDVRAREIRWPAREGDITGDPARLQIATDITLRKATQDIERQQQDKVQFTARLMTLGEMASSLAHELNQPLTAITNYSEGTLARLSGGAMAPEELRAAITKTAKQAQRAGGIIRRIREFVKRSEPSRRATPAARIVEDAIAFAEIEASKKGIAIAVDIETGLPPVDVDPILIEQVLLNLLKNSIDAMDTASLPRIDVQARRSSENMAQFTVIDRGAGIPPEHLANLFTPFFSTKAEGMGMGLNICRSIIEFHQGQLSVAPNPEPTGGTVMRFTLPLALTDADALNAATLTEHPHQ